jgi:hypothetical protein
VVSGSGPLSPVCPQDVHSATFGVAVAAAQAARSHSAEAAVLRGRVAAALTAAAGAERLVEQAVAAKEDAERTLCVRFAHILNAQKEKYRAVAEDLESARARLGDGDGGTSDDEAGVRTQETTRDAYDSRGVGLGDASLGAGELGPSQQGQRPHVKTESGGAVCAAAGTLLAKVMGIQPPESQHTQAASPMKRDGDDDLAATRPRKVCCGGFSGALLSAAPPCTLTSTLQCMRAAACSAAAQEAIRQSGLHHGQPSAQPSAQSGAAQWHGCGRRID